MATDRSKKKEQLIQELSEMRLRIAELEKSEIELKRVDEALRESEEKHRLLVKNSHDVIYTINPEGVFTYVSPSWTKILGHPVDEVVGRPFPQFVHEEDIARCEAFLRKVIDTGESQAGVEYRVKHKNGSWRWHNTNAIPLKDETGAVVGFEGSASDITGRKSAEEALLLTQFAMDHAPDSILLVNDQGRVEYANKASCTSMGYTRKELSRMRIFEIDPDFPIEGWEQHKKTLKHLGRMTIYGRHRTKDGRLFPVEVHTNYLEYKGRFLAVAFDRDITDRRRTEEELKENRRRLADIIEFLPDATLVIDKGGKVIAWNRAMELLTGIKKKDMLGKGNYEYALPLYCDRRPILVDLALHPDGETERQQYGAIRRVGDVLFAEGAIRTSPSSDLHLSAAASILRDEKGEIIGAIECVRDNTERKQLEERLNRAERMEALGTLAGGVAHDLNNVLGVMVGYSELLLGEFAEDSPARKYANSILRSSLKSAAIIQDLLTLARRGITVSEVVDLNQLVFDYVRTPEFEKIKAYHPNVKIWTELADGLLNIKGSPVHLGKTLMNLVSNAAESISGEGNVTIRTENRYLEQPIRGAGDMREGDYVTLAVSDTGSGIPSGDMGKIFEPFYTKKVMGRSGTGLGLAVVWGTVKDHNGYVDVQSREGRGTTFTLYFPATRQKPTKAEKPASPVTYRGNGESILVVDDMKEQRELAMSMFTTLGYQVETVPSGEAAVEYLKNKAADLIVLDMIMDPGIDGMETYRRIREINPNQKAIIVSGFAETDRVRQTHAMGAGAFVRKPYVLEKIGLAVRQELDRK